MAYANLAAATKLHRTNQVIADIGSSGLMKFYTGAHPATPDIATAGVLLASLPLSSPVGTSSYAVLGGSITATGSGGTDGTYVLTITPATSDHGTGAAGVYTVNNGVLSSIQISNNGVGYGAAPTLGGFSTSGLVGASAVASLTAILVFGAIGTANGVAGGTAGFVRIVNGSGVGIIDLDVGTTNSSSVIMNNTFITLGGAVTCVAEVLIEG